MRKPYFYIVDVFAEEKYAGNQLAVVLDAQNLTTAEMQKIAREMNYSETTFIVGKEKGAFNVRIFTPERELPFAGHPTLGTAFIIREEILKEPVAEVILNLKVGPIPVNFNHPGDVGIAFMRQNTPNFGQKFSSETVAPFLGLKIEDIDERFPIEEVSTGLSFIIVPLKTLEGVKKCRLNKELFFSFIEKTEAKDVLVFAPETYSPDNHLNVRVFTEYEGIPEDPATGSANGCLAAYLVKHRYFGEEKIDLRVEQGYEIKRPSRLYLKAWIEDEIIVKVGGKVIPVAKGELI